MTKQEGNGKTSLLNGCHACAAQIAVEPNCMDGKTCGHCGLFYAPRGTIGSKIRNIFRRTDKAG